MKLTKPFILSAAIALISQSPIAMANDYDDMKKQLQIMDNIIESSLADVGSARKFSLGRVDSTYLKGQGVVITIDSRSSLSHWAKGFSLNLPDMPVIAPDVDIDINEDEIERMTEEAMELAEHATEAMESFYEGREGFHQIRESQRDAQYRLRDVTRELRDLEYQLKVAPEKEVAKLNSKKSEFDQVKRRYC